MIDEARTPLIISGQSGKSTKLYEACDILAKQMERGADMEDLSKLDAIMGVEQEESGDFVVNEKDKVVNLTEQGVAKVERFSRLRTSRIRRIWKSSIISSWPCVQITSCSAIRTMW